MSEQELHFADPDWQPSQSSRPRRASARSQPAPSSQDALPINDASTQSQTGDATWAQQDKIYPGGAGDGDKATYDPYEAGYRSRQAQGAKTSQANGAQSWQTHKGRARQPLRSRTPWLAGIIALLILLIAIFSLTDEITLLVIPIVILLMFALSGIITFLAFAIQRGHVNSNRERVESRSFAVGAQPKIIVKNDMGIIHVHAGDQQDHVIVQVTHNTWGFLSTTSRSDVQYEQNIEKNRLSIKARSAWHILGKHSVSLDITVPRFADLELKSEAGGVTVSDVEGQMSLVSEAGSVKANEVVLYGDSRLKTNAGSITFNGSLDSNGSYSMTTDAGGVTVTLPAASSFRLDARTDVGNINTHFPFTIQRDFPGAKARGKVGPGPHPSLKLRTDVGSINLWQG